MQPRNDDHILSGHESVKAGQCELFQLQPDVRSAFRSLLRSVAAIFNSGSNHANRPKPEFRSNLSVSIHSRVVERKRWRMLQLALWHLFTQAARIPQAQLEIHRLKSVLPKPAFGSTGFSLWGSLSEPGLHEFAGVRGSKKNQQPRKSSLRTSPTSSPATQSPATPAQRPVALPPGGSIAAEKFSCPGRFP